METGGIKECGPSKYAVEGKSIQKTNKMPRDSTTTKLALIILFKMWEGNVGHGRSTHQQGTINVCYSQAHQVYAMPMYPRQDT